MTSAFLKPSTNPTLNGSISCSVDADGLIHADRNELCRLHTKAGRALPRIKHSLCHANYETLDTTALSSPAVAEELFLNSNFAPPR